MSSAFCLGRFAAKRALPAILAGAIFASPLAAQTRYLAFGDSITSGFGDTLPEEDPAAGYPARLESLVSDITVAKFGFGGKTTTELLNEEVDAVFSANPADVLLLMAGTNDVTQRRTGGARSVSEETSIFNLGAIADRAQSFGIASTIHATVIPRSPVAKKDPDNIDNQSFNQAVRDFVGDVAGMLVDPYEAFLSTPSSYPALYYSTDPNVDPVGHPNSNGYDLLAETFADVLNGVDSVAPVPGSMFPKKGDTDVAPNPAIVVEMWDFGDGIDLSSAALLLNGVDTGISATGSSFNAVLQYQPLSPLSGTVSLAVRASDLASPSNRTERVIATFTILGSSGALDGDVDGNGRVDGFDLLALALSFGADANQIRYNEDADLNGDSVVDGSDLAVLASNFGRSST